MLYEVVDSANIALLVKISGHVQGKSYFEDARPLPEEMYGTIQIASNIADTPHTYVLCEGVKVWHHRSDPDWFYLTLQGQMVQLRVAMDGRQIITRTLRDGFGRVHTKGSRSSSHVGAHL